MSTLNPTAQVPASATEQSSEKVIRKHAFESVGGADWEVFECRDCRRSVFAGLGMALANNRVLMRFLPQLRCRAAR